jgi:hypothetical protein
MPSNLSMSTTPHEMAQQHCIEAKPKPSYKNADLHISGTKRYFIARNPRCTIPARASFLVNL